MTTYNVTGGGSDPTPAAPDEEACRCGRPVQLLNHASGQAKCICGYIPDLCRCQPLTEGSDPS